MADKLFFTLESSPWQGPVISFIGSLPDTLNPGDIYAIRSGTIDASLAGHENHILYIDDNSNQIYIAPKEGMFLYNKQDGNRYKFVNGSWVIAEVDMPTHFRFWDDHSGKKTTSSTNNQTYYEWEIHLPRDGNYLINWQILWTTNTWSTSIIIDTFLDNNQIERIEDTTDSNYKSSYYGMHYQYLTEGTHKIKIEYRRGSGRFNSSVTIYKAKLFVEEKL